MNICPGCDETNGCAAADKGSETLTHCWCFDLTPALALPIPDKEKKQGNNCYCKRCLIRLLPDDR